MNIVQINTKIKSFFIPLFQLGKSTKETCNMQIVVTDYEE